jgi:cytochrome c peroxidase
LVLPLLLFALGTVFLHPVGRPAHAGPPDAAAPQRAHPFAMPAEVPAPADNPTTPAKVALGHQLFFDTRLSGDNSMSCATCHPPDKAFADGRPKALGVGGKTLARNTPTLLNVALYSSFFWDGRASSLEEQALVPITSPEEMNQDLPGLEKKLRSIPGYVAQFQDVFGEPPTAANVARALAAFQRTLLTRNSPFDRFIQGETGAIPEEARRGWELFRGPAGCVRCHLGPNFTDSRFYRLGTSVLDQGRATVTGATRDRHAFRTPGLRDVARTGPYLHDGSQETLTAVVEFYFRGVPTHPPDGIPLDIEPVLSVSFGDVAALVAFLESLNGELPAVEEPDLP